MSSQTDYERMNRPAQDAVDAALARDIPAAKERHLALRAKVAEHVGVAIDQTSLRETSAPGFRIFVPRFISESLCRSAEAMLRMNEVGPYLWEVERLLPTSDPA